MTKIKFLVLSRAQVQSEGVHKQFTEPHILISINDPKDGNAKLPNNEFRKDALFLTFSDIDQRSEVDNENIIFTHLMADDILEFVDKYVADVKFIIVHCFAGVCRSVACASALSKILNNEDDKIFKSGVPNMLVYKTILEQYFLTKNYHMEWSHIHGVALQHYPEY